MGRWRRAGWVLVVTVGLLVGCGDDGQAVSSDGAAGTTTTSVPSSAVFGDGHLAAVVVDEGSGDARLVEFDPADGEVVGRPTPLGSGLYEGPLTSRSVVDVRRTGGGVTWIVETFSDACAGTTDGGMVCTDDPDENAQHRYAEGSVDAVDAGNHLDLAADGGVSVRQLFDVPTRSWWEVQPGDDDPVAIEWDRPIESVRVSPDGRRIAVLARAGFDGTTTLEVRDVADPCTACPSTSVVPFDQAALLAGWLDDGRVVLSGVTDRPENQLGAFGLLDVDSGMVEWTALPSAEWMVHQSRQGQVLARSLTEPARYQRWDGTGWSAVVVPVVGAGELVALVSL